MQISQQIEALLFAVGKPMSVNQLAKTLEVQNDQVHEGLQALKKAWDNRGVMLVQNNNQVAMVTRPEAYNTIAKTKEHENAQDLSRAALETLSIVLYHPDITKADIDYIRGVNSQFILRALLLRGLIERRRKSNTSRYQPTLKTLQHLGVESVTDLPDYQKTHDILAQTQIQETNAASNMSPDDD